MNEENTRILGDTFPRLYRDLRRDKPQQPIGRGFECGDGWFQLIFDLSTNIEKVASKLGIDPASDDWPEALQVKEKFGGLRYYIRTAEPDELEVEKAGEMISVRPISGNVEIQSLCRDAEKNSLTICEDCGALGTFRRRGWVRVTCDSCEEKRLKGK